MKTEWMLTADEIIRLIEQLEELDPQPSLSKWVADAQAKKLLEYLIDHWFDTDKRLNGIMEMLKELEAKQ